jgi:hypothetical protein
LAPSITVYWAASARRTCSFVGSTRASEVAWNHSVFICCSMMNIWDTASCLAGDWRRFSPAPPLFWPAISPRR